MPLARGSAFCGYVSILGAFLAAGAPVRATMPKVSIHPCCAVQTSTLLSVAYKVYWPACLPGPACPALLAGRHSTALL